MQRIFFRRLSLDACVPVQFDSFFLFEHYQNQVVFEIFILLLHTNRVPFQIFSQLSFARCKTIISVLALYNGFVMVFCFQSHSHL